MRYEEIHGLRIPKVGLGCYGIGGGHMADRSQDERSLAALHSALSLGYTHFDTAEGYAGGHSEELVGQAIREAGVKREDLFITTKVSPEHLSYDGVLRSNEGSLRRLGMDYVDLYLIHWPRIGMKLEETFRALNRLVDEGKVRHLGVSNFNLKLLKQAAALSEMPLLANQVSYSLPDRSSVENGVLAHCQANDILLTAYTPVKRRYVAGNPKVKQVAQARGLTVHQVAIAWLTSQPRVITIPASLDPRHQAENLQAAEVVLTNEELASFQEV